MSYQKIQESDPKTLKQISQEIQRLQNLLNKLNRYANNIGTKNHFLQSMDELIDDRKVYENLIREICEDLKVFKPSRAEKGYKNKLVQDYKEIVKQFVVVQDTIMQKEKEVDQIIRNTIEGSFKSEVSDQNQTITMEEIGQFETFEWKERQEKVEQLEKDFQEVNQLFKEVATVVLEQGEMLEEIDESTELVVEQTAKGKREIKQAENYQQRSFKKLIIIGCILIIIIAIIVVLIIEL